jgi:hypothetical protein
LKDKGQENGEYGAINSNVEGKEWVSIPLAAKNPNAVGVESKAGFQTVPLFPVSYDYKDPAAQDITVNVAVNNSLLAGTGATPLPTSAYQVPTQTVTVKAGQRVSDPFAISMNTSTLDPSITYGIAFSITGVSKSGVGIPSNMKDVIFLFTIKNKYDGVYSYTAKYDWPSDRDPAWPRTEWTYPYETALETTGPNTVSFYNDAYAGTLIPLMTPGASGLGATAMDITFDASDKVVAISNPAMDSRQRNVTLAPGGNSRYDAATKTLYLELIFTQNGFQPAPFHIKMKYTKPRA